MKRGLLPQFLITIIMSVGLTFVLFNVDVSTWMAVVLIAALVMNIVLFVLLLVVKKRIDQQSS